MTFSTFDFATGSSDEYSPYRPGGGDGAVARLNTIYDAEGAQRDRKANFHGNRSKIGCERSRCRSNVQCHSPTTNNKY